MEYSKKEYTYQDDRIGLGSQKITFDNGEQTRFYFIEKNKTKWDPNEKKNYIYTDRVLLRKEQIEILIKHLNLLKLS